MNRFPHVLKKSPLTYIRGRTVLLYNVPNLNIIHSIVNLPDRIGHMLLLVLELKRNNQDHRFEGFMGFDSSVFCHDKHREFHILLHHKTAKHNFLKIK